MTRRSAGSGSVGLPVALAALVALLPASPAAAAAADEAGAWRMAMHDPQHRNASPAKARLDSAPAVRWRLPIDSRPQSMVALDVDLLPGDEYAGVESGAVVVRDGSGKLRWRTGAIGALDIMGLADLDGDGRSEVWVRCRDGGRIFDRIDGKQRFATPGGQFAELARFEPADIDGDGVVEVIAANRGGYATPLPGNTWIFRADGSLIGQLPELDPLGAKAFVVNCGVADVDGDGGADLFCGSTLVQGKGQVFAYRLRDQTLLGSGIADEGRRCALVTSIPRPGQTPLLLCAADSDDGTNTWHGVAAYAWTDNVLQRVWIHEYAPAPGLHLRMPLRVGDFDGDGSLEILSALETKDGNSMFAIDALSGAPIQGGPAPLRSVLGPGASVALVLVGTKTPTKGTEPLTIARWSRATGQTPIWTLGAASPALLRPTSADAPGLLLLSRDLDGDGVAERLALASIAPTGSPTFVAQRTFEGVPLPVAIGHAADGSLRVAVSERSGAVHLLDEALTTRNDGDGDGAPDLWIRSLSPVYLSIAPRKVGGKDVAVALSQAGLVQLFDPVAADPITAPTVALTLRPAMLDTRANLVDLDGDGQRELAIRSTPNGGTPTLEARTLTGDLRWSYVHPDQGTRWTLVPDALTAYDVNGDGAEDLLLGWNSPSLGSTFEFGNVLDGKSGQALWPAKGACNLALRALLSVDASVATPVGWGSMYTERARCDLATGAVLAKATLLSSSRYGAGMLADLDGQAGDEVVWAGPGNAFGAETAGFVQLWVLPSKEFENRPATLLRVAGAWVAISVRGVDRIVAFDALTGAEAFTRRYRDGVALPKESTEVGSAIIGLVGADDLRGLGAPSALISTADGHLLAIDPQSGDVQWDRPYGASIGAPVVADVDADGELEILIATPDGVVEALDRDVLSKIAWVRDNDGEGPALSDAADIDTAEDVVVLHANWAEAVGASGYSVRVVDANGGEISPRQDVGAKTSASIEGLELTPGGVYHVEVVAYAKLDKGAIESTPKRSDGVTIVDVSPPEIVALTATPATAASGRLVDVALQARDRTRLRRLSLQVRDGDGVLMASREVEVAAREAQLALPWQTVDATGAGLPPGTYEVRAEVVDGAEHTTTQTLKVEICAADVPESLLALGLCGPPAPDVGADVAIEDDQGCGCSVTGKRRPPSVGAFGLLALLAAGWLWQRRRGQPRATPTPAGRRR